MDTSWCSQFLKNSLLIDIKGCFKRHFNSFHRLQISSRIQVGRLIDSICQNISTKENYDDLCGDILAVRIIAQNVGIQPAAKTQLHGCLKMIFTRFKDEFFQDGKLWFLFCVLDKYLWVNFFFFVTEESPPKKRKLNPPNQQLPTAAVKNNSENDHSSEDISIDSKSTNENDIENKLPEENDTNETSKTNKKLTPTSAVATAGATATTTATNEIISDSSSSITSSDSELQKHERKILKIIEHNLEAILGYFENGIAIPANFSIENKSLSESE